MFPVRCYTCNSVLAQHHPAYTDAIVTREKSPATFFEETAISRMCCRRMFLGYVDLTREQLLYGNTDTAVDQHIMLKRHVSGVRDVSCD